MRAALTWLLATSRQANTLRGQQVRRTQRVQTPSETNPRSGPPNPSALEDVVPDPGDGAFSAAITLNDALRMEWDYFECLIAAMWQKQSYKTVYRTPQHDDGVDVVAINGTAGVLIQCKTCGLDEAALSWDAVKEVVAGEAAYRMRHPESLSRKCALQISSLIIRL